MALNRPSRSRAAIAARSQTVPSAKTISSIPVARPRKCPATVTVSIW
nr:hypothetical protein [Mangrovicoccus ximenensis]